MSRRSIGVGLATCIVAVLVVASWVRWRSEPSKPLTVSRETTYFVEPLDSEGHVDYLAAVNQLAGRGVTPENNFEVVFRSVVGPRSIGKRNRQEYFRRLGIKSLAEARPYFQDFDTFHAAVPEGKRGELSAEQQQLNSQPWTAAEHPRGAAWLNAMNPFLDRIVEGTRRPRMYTPYVEWGSSGIGLFPSVGDQCDMAESLLIRANFRAASGDFDGAWSDLQAIHRHARLSGGKLSVWDGIVGLALDSMALQADVSLLHSGRLTPGQKRQFLGDLLAFGPPASIMDEFVMEGRLGRLQLAQLLARGRLTPAAIESELEDVALEANWLIWYGVDWNDVFRQINETYDAVGEAYGELDWLKREHKVELLKARLHAMQARETSWSSTPKTRGRILGALLLLASGLEERVDREADSEARGKARLAVTQIAFALEVFRDEHGDYPPSLEALAPGVMRTVLLDPFTARPLVYRQDTGTGFVVYSVGPNKTDDRGRGGRDWDDLAATGQARKE